MNKEDFEACTQAWKDYPSQDNEGYQPERGGFKCGWIAALRWERERKKQQKTLVFVYKDYLVSGKIHESIGKPLTQYPGEFLGVVEREI